MPLSSYLGSAHLRLAARYAGLFAMSIAILLGVIYWDATREMSDQLRDGIGQDVETLTKSYAAGGLSRLAGDVAERTSGVRSREAVYQLLDASGRTIAGTALRAAPFVGLKTIPSPTPNHPARTVLARGVRLGDALLIVGRSTHTIDEVQNILVDAFIWALALTLPIALLIGLAMSRAALRRVQAVNETAREIMAGNLTRRVPTFGTGDEIDTLARTVNGMLERIEQLMRNLQQVTSDIAHDLRTPIGRLKQRFERARMDPQGPDGTDALVAHAITDLDQILDTFNAVLRIAEIEAGERRARFTEVDLSGLAEAVMDLYETVAEDLGQRLLADISPGVVVTGDGDLVTQMLANLVENALRHTPGGTEIRLGLAERDGHATLVVTDNGPGIPASHRDRVTDRFYRLEQSRTTAGSGLGLALVKAIADLHGATLTLADNEPGLRVTVRF